MSNFSLYQANALALLERHIDFETGQVDIEAFNQAQIALHDKQLAVVAYLKNEDGRIALLNNAIKELQAREKAMQSRHEALKKYLLDNMQQNNITRLEALDLSFVASVQNNPPSVVIDDESAIPADYWRIPPMPAPVVDKTLIKSAIKDGFEVAGAHLTTTQRLVIK